MFEALSDYEKEVFNLAVSHINDGLCRGQREFSVHPSCPTELIDEICDAFRLKNKNGQEFFGVTGVGISEVGKHSSGKATVTDER